MDDSSYAVLELLHSRMFLVASGGFLRGYDDETLNALVAIPIEHDVHLILREPNDGRSRFTRRLISTVQQYSCERGVKDAKLRAVTKEPITNQHRLIVCPSVIEQDIYLTKLLGGERGPSYRLFYQTTRMVCAKSTLA